MEKVKKLAKIVKDMNLLEIEYMDENFEVRIKNKENALKKYNKSNNFDFDDKNIDNDEEKVCDSKEKTYIKSNMIGTFYSSPSQDEESFVKDGDRIKKDQVVCIVESMKLMNELKSTLDCEIVKCLVSDGDLVEFGENLFEVKEL